MTKSIPLVSAHTTVSRMNMQCGCQHVILIFPRQKDAGRQWHRRLCTWRYDIEEFLEIIHPDFSQAPVVLVDYLARSSREAVWGGLPENMAHVWACYNFQHAAALPDLQTRTDNADLYSVWHGSRQSIQKWIQHCHVPYLIGAHSLILM